MYDLTLLMIQILPMYKNFGGNVTTVTNEVTKLDHTKTQDIEGRLHLNEAIVDKDKN